MPVNVIITGRSRSFPKDVPPMPGSGTVLAGTAAADVISGAAKACLDFVAVELNNECLGHHIGLDADPNTARIVGFARFRLGTADPSNLIELVSMDWTDEVAVAAAKAAFNTARFDNDVALVHALDGTNQNFLAARHELVEQHFALGIANLLQDDLFGRHGANAANGQ